MKTWFAYHQRKAVFMAVGTLASSASTALDLAFPSVPLSVAGSADPNIMLVLDSSGSMRNIVPEAPFSESPDLRSPADNASTKTYYQVSGSNTVTNAAAVCSSFVNENRLINLLVPVAGGVPRFSYDGNSEDTARVFGNALCFNPTGRYNAKLNVNAGAAGTTTTCTVNGTAYYCPEPINNTIYLASEYTGNYLNWFFNPSSTTGPAWNGGTQTYKPVGPAVSSVIPTAKSRIQIARAAAINLVNTMDGRLRVGLTVYNGNNGGKLYDGTTAVGPLSNSNGSDSGKRALLVTALTGVDPGGNTPLAETLQDVGRYFASGNNSGTMLALHPEITSSRSVCGYTGNRTRGTSSCDQSPDNVFNNHLLGNTTTATTPPVALSCQKSFIAFLTDGRNTEDQAISTYLQDYDGDCTDGSGNAVSSTICPNIGGTNAERKSNRAYDNTANTSDYMDDVAKALFDMDLRPDGFPSGTSTAENAFKNNVTTYMIGFADPAVRDDPLLESTARQGSGGTDGLKLATDSASLATTFDSIIDSILKTKGSASNAATSSGRLDDGSRLYQASFNSGDWSGSLKSFRISQGGTTTCSVSTAAGSVCPVAEWDAATRLNAKTAANRMIYTYTPTAKVGATFDWSSLEASQQTLLRRNPGNPVTIDSVAVGMSRLDYLRGDSSNEGSTTGKFRTRSTKLGDIVNSDPVLVGAPRFNYNFTGYAAFRNAQRTRSPVIYVGANDGMLHGFLTADRAADTTASPAVAAASAGDEVMAYIPNLAYGSDTAPTLSKLTQVPYNHQFAVDGSQRSGDVQLGTTTTTDEGTWATVLVGSMRSGGKGMFALNVTNPNNFTTTNASRSATKPDGVVMWEFTNADDSTLGNTYSQPSIVKMRNGRWAAVFGNGYNSTATDGKAALFIVFLDGPGGTGKTWRVNNDYIKLTVNSGFTAAVAGVVPALVPNGLGSPIPIDLNGDRLTDFIYAGDLNGNLWRFDVDNVDPTKWAVGYGTSANPPVGRPVYTAQDAATLPNRQPLTGRPEVGLNANTADVDDVTIYFGTGKYLEGTDNTQANQPNQTFYAINDVIYSDDAATTKVANPVVTGRSVLLKQDILKEVVSNNQTFRLTSNNTYNTTTPEKGWYMDLFNKNNVLTAQGGAGNNRGERSFSAPVLSSGRVLFSTQIPAASACSGSGSGFLMSLDAKNGSRLPKPAFNVNTNSTIDENDVLEITTGVSAAVSGRQSQVGMTDTPVLFNIGNNEDSIFLTGTGNGTDTPPEGCASAGGTGILDCPKTTNDDRLGRITWREIIK